jgi:preprotein translocase SecF subunit
MKNKVFGLMKLSPYTVAFSMLVILAAIVVWIFQGFVLGIDFSGGTLLTLDMGKTFGNPEAAALQPVVQQVVAKDFQVAATENNQCIIRFQASKDDPNAEMAIREALMTQIKKTYPDAKVVTQDRVGATAGAQMTENALISVGIASVLMLAYIWYRFEFAFAVGAIAALLHDVIFMCAVMLFTRTQVNSTFIAALLTIIGYSVNDTIVLFDRIRENVKRYKDKSREEIVELSFSETLTRTINTSLTVFVTITALYIVGVQSIKEFTLPLIAGTVSGVYSTIMFASPIWVWIHRAQDNRRKKKIAAKKLQAKGGAKKPAKSKA